MSSSQSVNIAVTESGPLLNSVHYRARVPCPITVSSLTAGSSESERCDRTESGTDSSFHKYLVSKGHYATILTER